MALIAGAAAFPRRQALRFSRSANDATDYFQILTGRVVEVGRRSRSSLAGKERPTDAGLNTYQQAIWGLPAVSRVPVAKHPCFGRYFWALFEAVAGRDLMTSFDRPRAESSPALTLKQVAANTTATIPKKPTSVFTLIVKPPSVASARYHTGREIRTP
jgi:hypothetical protein